MLLHFIRDGCEVTTANNLLFLMERTTTTKLRDDEVLLGILEIAVTSL